MAGIDCVLPATRKRLLCISAITQVEFPVLEWRLFRDFSVNQSSGLLLQPYVGFNTPTTVSVISPTGVPNPDAHTIVTTGVRFVFDWRHYLK